MFFLLLSFTPFNLQAFIPPAAHFIVKHLTGIFVHTGSHTHTHTHPYRLSLLDIKGASGHSVVPVPQLVVLGANHQPSGGLVHSAATSKRREREEKMTPEKTEKNDLGKVE